MNINHLRDGDALVTSHGFIFYIFGYNHPEDCYNAFLKYIPAEHQPHFDLEWLDFRWHHRGSTLLRPSELYNPEQYPNLVRTFRKSFPDYLRFSRQLNRWMIVVPKELITDVYIPSRQLTLLLDRGGSDILEEKALTLIRILSNAAKVPLKFFGIHGSINIGMHHEGSDIDIAVYGASHFRLVKHALIELESEGSLALKRDTRIEAKRLNRGLFQSIDFVVNATRLISEIKGHPDVERTLGVVEVECRCSSAEEAMFRPAIYGVEKCSSLLGYDPIVEDISQLVSMVGTYRDVLEVGERLKARGMMEEVIEDGLKRHRVVIGSALPGEYIDWVG